MKQKICPMCLLDEFFNWFRNCDRRETEDEYIEMIEEGMATLYTGLEDGMPSSYLCEKHRKDRAEQMGLFDKEVVQGEGAN